MRTHWTAYRVLYRDIDSMGVLYYGRYLALFEMGRVEWMRSEGCRYRDLETSAGVLLPVTEAQCRYRQSIRYDDLAVVRTEVLRWTGTRVRFGHRIVVPPEDAPQDPSIWRDLPSVAEGEVELGCVRAGDQRPTRLPAAFTEVLQAAGPARSSGAADRQA